MHPIQIYEWIYMFSIMLFIISVIDIENWIIGSEGSTEGLKFYWLRTNVAFWYVTSW